MRKPVSGRREGSPHTERAVLSGAAQQGKQAGKASRLSDKSVKKEAGGEKGKDKVKLEGGRLQTNPPQRKAPQQTLLWRQQCRRYYSEGERVMLKYKPLFTCSPKFLNSC